MTDSTKVNNTTESGSNQLLPRDVLIKNATKQFIDEKLPILQQQKLDYQSVASLLFAETMLTIEQHNLMRSKNAQLRFPQSLTPQQIGDLMMQYHSIKLIDFIGDATSRDNLKLASYQDSGSEKGLYTISNERLRRIARQFNYELSDNAFDEVLSYLQETAELVIPTQDKNIIPVNNGIFDYKKQKLIPFSKDYILMTKARTNYNPKATNITIHNDDDGTDWDVESWMKDLSDDPQIVDALWATVTASIRPFNRWDKMVLLYSEQGNNGKGTFCSMIRNVLGTKATASISLFQFSKQFGLTSLIGINTVLTDENPVGSFIGDTAALKSAVTGDSMMIDIKHKEPITYKFNGFIIQCVNELPKTQDRSDSFYRRQLFIPMTKLFTGRERKYIKEDYLKRQEVLEYILHRALHHQITELPVPQSSAKFLDEYKSYNDPVREFFYAVESDLKWEKVPFAFLYDLYKSWSHKNNSSGKVKSSSTFTNEIKQILVNSDKWDVLPNAFKPTAKMKETAEPMILHYKLDDWTNPNYRGNNPDKKALPHFISSSYRGIQKR